MKKFLKVSWPSVATTGLFLIGIAVLLLKSYRINQNNFIYALDDAYIHMAIAKNVAFHGVWGLGQFEFASASSSLLWTCLLSFATSTVGTSEILPFLLNLICVVALIVLCDRYCMAAIPQASVRFVLLLLAVLLPPLPAVAFTGMEHTLHILIAALFVICAVRLISSDDPPGHFQSASLIALAFLVTAIRFEGIFMVAVTAALLVLRRRLLLALLVVTAMLLPIAVYGAYSLSQGSFFLPNTILLKGYVPPASFRGFLEIMGLRTLIILYRNPHLAVLALATLAAMHVAARDTRPWSPQYLGPFILVASLFLHIQFAGIGWFYRYEAYLVFLGVMILPPVFVPAIAKMRVANQTPRTLLMRGATTVFVLVLLFPLFHRAQESIERISKGTKSIYLVNYQIGRFLKEHYNGGTVVVNDVGCPGYFCDLHIVDFWGLGSVEVTRLLRAHRFTPITMEEVARRHHAQIAVLREHWFTPYGGLPLSWKRVGTWTVSDSLIVVGDLNTFFAMDSSGAVQLRAALEEFQTQLPPGVEQYLSPR